MKLFSIGEDGKFINYAEHDFKKENREEDLESWLENNPAYVLEDENVLIIGRQVPTNLGSIIDLLSIDKEGNTVIIELKRDRTPRETLAQLLEYASFAEDLSYSQLEELFKQYSSEENLVLADYHRSYFQLQADDAVAFNKNQKLMIVGQTITKEIKQTSSFLRKKGIEVFCLEFKYFETKAGERIISTEFVIGKDSSSIKKVSTGTLPRINKEKFLNSLDSHGKDFFKFLLEFAEENNLPIHWGSKGFSLNVDLGGNHVPLLYGYPPHAVFGQSIYTATYDILRKVKDAEAMAEGYKQGVNQLGMFKPTKKDMRLVIKKPMGQDYKDNFLKILASTIDKIKENGLKE